MASCSEVAHGPRAPIGSLGVLGGMGPAATADFLLRLAEATPAEGDQGHVPVVVYGDCTTPDRSDALERGGASPVPKLLVGIRFLDAVGVSAIAVPCNSAHVWHNEMQSVTRRPVLHIAQAVVTALESLSVRPSRVGVLATEGTLRAGMYDEHLRAAGFSLVRAPEALVSQLMESIRAVKAGRTGEGATIARLAAEQYVALGAQGLVVGCTDLSVALAGQAEVRNAPLIDANRALARHCVWQLRNLV